MEPTNINNTSPAAVLPSVPAQSTEIPAPKPIDNLKDKFNKLPKNTKTMIIIATSLFIILFLLLILSLMFGKRKTTVTVTPTPVSISVTPGPDVILNASRYATDSGVLKIETDLKEFTSQLNGSDVKQSDLTVPNIDFNINFNQ
jgi:hypothetical protein